MLLSLVFKILFEVFEIKRHQILYVKIVERQSDFEYGYRLF